MPARSETSPTPPPPPSPAKHRLLRRAQTVWSIIGIALALLLAIELALEWATSGPPPIPIDAYAAGAPQLADHELATLTAEMRSTVAAFESTGNRWQPFAYWRNRSFQGQFVNVDQDGLRRTVVEAADPSAAKKPTRVFFLGGSTMWGVGNRDERTIPSLVAQKLHSATEPIEATNFAQLGYVSTQERIALEQELHRGNVPDLVVFLDGYNDLSSALLNQTAGVSLQESARAAEFQILRRPARELFWQSAQSMALVRLFAQARPAAYAPATPWRSPDEFARATATAYLANVRIVESLKQGFSFDALYCWQPVLYEKSALSEFEKSQMAGRQGQAELCRAVYAQARKVFDLSRAGEAVNPPRMLYLGDAFNDPAWEGKTAFYDRCHLSEPANDWIADRIVAELRELIAKRRANQQSGTTE